MQDEHSGPSANAKMLKLNVRLMGTIFQTRVSSVAA